MQVNALFDSINRTDLINDFVKFLPKSKKPLIRKDDRLDSGYDMYQNSEAIIIYDSACENIIPKHNLNELTPLLPQHNQGDVAISIPTTNDLIISSASASITNQNNSNNRNNNMFMKSLLIFLILGTIVCALGLIAQYTNFK